jgi:hypothetical protein
VLSTVGEILAAKRCNSTKGSANRIVPPTYEKQAGQRNEKICNSQWCGIRVILGPLLSASAVRHSEERQRVERVLIRAADAEFDVPGERRGSLRRIERRCREASERREHIDTLVVRDQHQRVVPERHVMPAVDEDVERKLSRRLWIDYQVPRAGDSGRVIGIWFAVTVERAASKRARVRLCRRCPQRTCWTREDQQDKDELACGCEA